MRSACTWRFPFPEGLEDIPCDMSCKARQASRGSSEPEALTPPLVRGRRPQVRASSYITWFFHVTPILWVLAPAVVARRALTERHRRPSSTTVQLREYQGELPTYAVVKLLLA